MNYLLDMRSTHKDINTLEEIHCILYKIFDSYWVFTVTVFLQNFEEFIPLKAPLSYSTIAPVL